MWMIEHPGTEDEHDEPHARGGGVSGEAPDSSCPGATAITGAKSLDKNSYLCSPRVIASADTSEVEEGFSERYNRMLIARSVLHFNYNSN